MGDLPAILIGIARACLVGLVWGWVAGVGAIWVMGASRHRWIKLIAISAVCGIVFAVINSFVNGLALDAPFMLVFASGTILPFFVIGFAMMGRAPDVIKD